MIWVGSVLLAVFALTLIIVIWQDEKESDADYYHRTGQLPRNVDEFHGIPWHKVDVAFGLGKIRELKIRADYDKANPKPGTLLWWHEAYYKGYIRELEYQEACLRQIEQRQKEMRENDS